MSAGQAGSAHPAAGGTGRRVALVTGASRGIGRAIADQLGDEGYALALVGHRHAAGMRAWVATRPWADRALCLSADQVDPDRVQAAMHAAVERFGRVDVCVANAGVYPRDAAPLHEAPVPRIRSVIEVNLLGTMWTARAWMAALARTGPRPDAGGSLVLIGSTAGRFGEAGHADYATSKAALVGLMLSLKNEVVRLDPYARVNLVQPGWTVTDMARDALEVPGAVRRICQTMPLRQVGRPRDVAEVVAFLCSDRARHVSGETITVAGGMEGRVLWSEGDIDEAAVRARSTEPTPSS